MAAVTKRKRHFVKLLSLLFWLSLYFYVPYFNPHLSNLMLSAPLIDAIVGSYGLVQLLLRIPVGICPDLLSRRKLFILLGFVCFFLSAFGMLLTRSGWVLYFLRGLAGLAASIWMVFTVLYNKHVLPGGILQSHWHDQRHVLRRSVTRLFGVRGDRLSGVSPPLSLSAGSVQLQVLCPVYF